MNAQPTCYQLTQNNPLTVHGLAPWVKTQWKPTKPQNTHASRPPSSSPVLPSAQHQWPPLRRRWTLRMTETATTSTSGAHQSRASACRTTPLTIARRAVLRAAILCLAALLFPPAYAATPAQPVTGAITFDSASVTGDFEVTVPLYGLLVQPQSKTAFSWSLEAEEVLVTWTRQNFTATSTPSGSTAIDPPASGQQVYRSATAHGSSRPNTAQFLMVANDPTQVKGAFEPSEIIIARNSADGWTIGPTANKTTPGDPNDPVTHHQELAADLIEVTADGGVATVTGNFTFYTWEQTIRIGDSQGEKTYESGNGSAPMCPMAAACVPAEIAYNRSMELVRLDLRNATISIDLGDQRFSVLGPLASASGRLELRTANTVGTLIQGGRTLAVESSMRLAGNGTVNSSVDFAVDRLAAAIEIAPDPVSGPPAFPVSSVPVNPSGAEAGQLAGTERPWWILLTAAPLALVGAVMYARRKPPTLDEVEWAVLNRQWNGQRLANRLVTSQPKNPDALFLLAATFLAKGRHRQLLTRIEPLAVVIPPNQRRGIALTLAAAAKACGEEGKFLQWAHEAVQDKTIRESVFREPGWASILGRAGVEPVPGYA